MSSNERTYRVMGHVRAVVPLAGVYLCLTGNVHPSNLVFALAIAGGLSVLASPPPWPILPRELPRALWTGGVYVLRLLYDIAKCGVTVAGYILRPSLPVRPGIVAVEGGTTSPAVLAASAHGITVTPGEQVLEIGTDGTLYTHALDAPGTAAGGNTAQTARVPPLSKILD